MNRYQDWPTRLDEFTRDAANRPFVWGEWDCALAAAAAVEKLTGRDFAADYRGYSDEAGAREALERVAGGGLAEAGTLALGKPLESVLLAQRGDICLMPTPTGPALGWCIGSMVAVAGLKGLVFLRLKTATMAWRV